MVPNSIAVRVGAGLCVLAAPSFSQIRSERVSAAQRLVRSGGPAACGPTREALDAAALDERVYFDLGVEEGWARGANYKLCFTTRARYLPFLSSAAPVHYPFELSIDSIRVGGRDVEFERDRRPRRDENTISYDRGVLSEVYDLAPRAVEQSFVLDHPLGIGDLELTLELGVDLQVRPLDGGWSFGNEFGEVRYGAATAIDARGEKLALASDCSEGRLTIVVPAAFAARAAYPLVIDPVIAAFGIEATPAESFSPDVCFDASGAAVLYVWESEFNANDHDVWADLYDPYGAPMYRGDWVDMTANYWARPRCANNGATNRFLVVAHVINNATGRVEIWGRTRDVNTALLSPQFKIAGGASYDLLDPVVGGDPFATPPSYFLVAYERVYTYGLDHDINGKLVTDVGTVLAGTVNIDLSVNTYDSVPSVSRSNGSDTWNLAWQRASPAGGNDILGARVGWNGVVTSATFPINVTGVDHTNPAASSSQEGAQRWVVAYEEDFGSDHDIVVTGVDGATVGATINMSSYDGSFWYQDQRWPSVDCDGSHFLCAYSELYGQSAVDYDAYATELLFNGASLAALSAHGAVSAGYGAELATRVAAAESSNPTGASRVFAIAVAREPDGAAFSSFDILGARFESTGGGAVAAFCDGATVACPCGNGASSVGGCPNSTNSAGAHLSWGGVASTTSDTLQLFCSGLPSGVTALFFQGSGSINGVLGAPFGDGVRCAAGPIRRLDSKVASSAGGSLYPAVGDAPISIAGSIPPAGATVVYQVWYRNPANFCTNATTNFSNALVVAWTP